MFDDHVIKTDNIIQRIDPRHRIATAVLFSFVVALCNHFPSTGIALGVSLFLAMVAGINARLLLHRLAVVLGFILLLWIVLPLTVPGTAMVSFGPFTPSRAGIELAARISLKVTAILTAFTALLATIPLSTFGHALFSMHVSKKIVHLILMTYRYIDLLASEYRRSLRAVRVRGFTPGTNLHTYRTYAYLIGMLLVRSLARAERIGWAMRCRGFQGQFHSLVDFRTTPASWGFTICMVLSTGCVAFMEWYAFLSDKA